MDTYECTAARSWYAGPSRLQDVCTPHCDEPVAFRPDAFCNRLYTQQLHTDSRAFRILERCFSSYYLQDFAIDPTCIDHHTRTVSEWTKDNTLSFGLRGMTRRFRDCLGR